MSRSRSRILHVEVGGANGGSIRALELFLKYTQSPRFVHDVLFYYPTNGIERIKQLSNSTKILYPAPPKLQDPGIPRRPRLRRMLSPAIKNRLLEARGWMRLLARLPAARALAKRIRHGNYDLVHVNNTPPYHAETILAAKLAGTPVIAHIRNPVPPGRFSRQILRWAGCLVSVNSCFAGQLSVLDPLLDIHVCYDGIELREPDAATASSLRATLLDGGDFLYGSVGRLDEQKGYEDLVRAAAPVLRENPGSRFAVAGDGPLRGALEALVHDLDLQDKFRFLGFRTDIPELLAAFDVFVFVPLGGPSAGGCRGHYAMQTGGCYHSGRTPEVVKAGTNGELVPPHDIDALSAAMSLAISKHSAQGYAIAEARNNAAALMDAESCARQFEAVIDKVLANRSSRTA